MRNFVKLICLAVVLIAVALPVSSEIDQLQSCYYYPQWNTKVNKYGYINEFGEWAIPATFDFAMPFSEGFAVVKNEEMWGLINDEGVWTFQTSSGHIDSLTIATTGVQSNLIVASIRQSNKLHYGYLTPYGEWAIPAIFNAAHPFVEGLAAASISVNGKEQWGYISKDGNWAIPAAYDAAEDFSEGLALIVQNKKCGYINKQGKIVIPLIFSAGDNFCNGLAVVQKYSDTPRFGYQGIINKSGNWVIWPQEQFRYIELPITNEPDLNGFILNNPEKPLLYGFMGYSGKWILPPIYQMPLQFTEGLCKQPSVIDQPFSLIGYIDISGQWVIPPQFSRADDFHHEAAFVVKTTENKQSDGFLVDTGYINKKGDWIFKNSTIETFPYN